VLNRCSLISRRFGAIALLFVLIFGCYLLVINPYIGLINGYRSEIASLGDKIERFNALVKQKDAFQRQLIAVKNNRAASQYFIKARTITLASAALQQKIKQVVQAQNGQLVSTQVSLPVNSLATENEKQNLRDRGVSVKVSMKATIESMYRVFYTLESGSPLVVIDNVSISRIHQGRRLNASSSQSQELLDVRYTVFAHMRDNL
jgi:general secretion pathway protein M